MSASSPVVPTLPPLLRADYQAPRVARSSWLWTIGPAYAGVFLAMPLLDRLGTWLLGETPPARQALAAVLAVLACYVLLYTTPALWGWKAGLRLSLVGASSFGTRGSEWINGVGLGLAAVVGLATSVFVALRMILLGLVSFGLVDVSSLSPWSIGGITLESPVVLVSTLFWLFILASANLLGLVGVIVSLMKVYSPIVLLVLAVSAAWSAPGQAEFESIRQAARAMDPGLHHASGGPLIFQLIFSYFAFSGLMAVDWGTTVRERSDIRIGGWMAILLTGSLCTLSGLLTAQGSLFLEKSGPRLPWSIGLTFQGGVFRGIGGIPGGIILMMLGLATLAPGCYATAIFGQRFHVRWPRVSLGWWTWLGALAAFALAVTNVLERLEIVFGILGAVLAPAVGVMTADALRQRITWQGIRIGWNAPGMAAWGLGLAIGLVPYLGPLLGWTPAQGFQPAALYAYAAAAGAYAVLSALGTEAPLVPLPAEA